MDDSRPPYIVTEVRPARKSGVFIVCLDNECALLCPDDILARWHLRKGAELTVADLEDLKSAAENALARRAALEMLARGRMSGAQLDVNLRRQGFSPPARSAAVARMRELGYIDDAAYARSLAGALDRRGSLGTKRIRTEMLKRGIERDLVDETLSEPDLEQEREKALALLRKRWRPGCESDPAAIRRLAAYLQRRGFDWSAIRWALAVMAPEVDTGSSEG